MNIRPLFWVWLPVEPTSMATRRYVGVLAHDLGQRKLPARHLGERNVLRGLGGPDDEAGILNGEEPLRDDHKQIA